MGIDPRNLTKIFQYGFTTKDDGHGFGLHNSALVAKELGGSLEVASEGLGKGATFTLTLPVGVRLAKNSVGDDGRGSRDSCSKAASAATGEQPWMA